MSSDSEAELRQRIERLETDYGYLKLKVDELDAASELEQKIAIARKRLGELKAKGEDSLDDATRMAEMAWGEVEGAFERLRKRFKRD
ncbi:hypothetical protein [Engelhardtia mirabilis]|uniref:Uncharacterized protein n=1 Tax=Engelhardtia mirabilis TaxID=2528011 RepID=A0A518BPR9_9BACT|nr:hypothetical protein Pla133_40850 [Planctomycetes bacterium Pla133]QDV03297.1 hypothetical protein Pla86_40840 [Planctomycetes bacterium Pla86]